MSVESGRACQLGGVSFRGDHGVDTNRLAGFMASNCALGAAVDAVPRGIAVEVFSGSTGAIPLSNSARSTGS